MKKSFSSFMVLMNLFALTLFVSNTSGAITLENNPETNPEIYQITNSDDYTTKNDAYLSSQACTDFKNFAHEQKVDGTSFDGKYKKLDPFKTDGLTIVKNGRVVYEWYDGIVTPKTSHVLWSASKMLTATLIHRTIQLGKTYKGIPFDLKTPLHLFFPSPPLLANQELFNRYIKENPRLVENYNSLTIKHLVEMSANFKWNEFYDDDITNSTFIPMLYLKERFSMHQYFLSQNISPEGPDNKWNYSGGNSNTLQAILAKIWGNEYLSMPNEILFKPLGITSARWERDGSGYFVGSSYAYLSARDYAKLGQLYLNQGQWGSEQLLSKKWVQEAQELTPVATSEATSFEYIKALGAQSKRLFWLNTDIIKKGKKFYGKEFPLAPSDMYFAAGHYGQLLIIIPSENLIISRTGYDKTYWDHIEPLALKTIECFKKQIF
ncbi:MAG: serine hydrolase [Bdellovibrionaceae bacterium]|nr:serine hydrolase [Pseudobdellovibrionaceae bacterium]